MSDSSNKTASRAVKIDNITQGVKNITSIWAEGHIQAEMLWAEMMFDIGLELRAIRGKTSQISDVVSKVASEAKKAGYALGERKLWQSWQIVNTWKTMDDMYEYFGQKQITRKEVLLYLSTAEGKEECGHKDVEEEIVHKCKKCGKRV